MPRTRVGPAFSPSTRARLAAFAPAWRLVQRHALLIPIVALAAWLRVSNLSGEHLHGDEAEYAIVARYLAHDPLALVYPALTGMSGMIFVSQPPLLLYLMAAASSYSASRSRRSSFPSRCWASPRSPPSTRSAAAWAAASMVCSRRRCSRCSRSTCR